MVGATRPLICIVTAIASLFLTAIADPAIAQEFVVEGQCRDGLPHGAYKLKMPDGRVRITGAFNRGKRTGTFLFWSSGGARLALLPFDEDVLNGTIALWYLQPDARTESRPKLEAPYSRGKPSGTVRSWFPNGRLRAEFRYEGGSLVSARAWNEAAVPLADGQARAMAAGDAENDAKYYETLAQIVRTHWPACQHVGAPAKL